LNEVILRIDGTPWGSVLDATAREVQSELADRTVLLAQLYCPVDTGTLRSSIRKEFEGESILVVAGGPEYINPKSHKGCDYAEIVEIRHPFMRPAALEAEATVNDLIASKLLAVTR
jgi:hypothetical protein